MACHKCHGTGWFKYSKDHSQVCDACCKHDKPWWLLSKELHGKVGWCCGNGCGKSLTYQGYVKFLKEKYRHEPIYMGVKH